jgi:hypothetical protein
MAASLKELELCFVLSNFEREIEIFQCHEVGNGLGPAESPVD